MIITYFIKILFTKFLYDFLLQKMDPMENQLCRVCEEPAAGFHFGAFTCEGCKSFFGRFCNNQTNIPDCKNNYKCVIDKRNRTSCKACRLRKCLAVGMSKSGCRYGRRSNWFKIHCLMQKNATNAANLSQNGGGKMMGKSMDYGNISPPPSAGYPKLQLPRAALPTGLPTIAATQPISITTSRTPTPPFMDSAAYSAFAAHSAASSLHSVSPVSSHAANQPPSPLSSTANSPSPLPHSPPLSSNQPQVAPFSSPLFDPLALYRLSPLFALQPLIQNAVAANDFHEQLRILAQRRAIYEASCAAAIAANNSERSAVNSAEDCAPIDLSVK